MGLRNILALDSALGGCTACVAAGARFYAQAAPMPRGQAEHLVPFADAAMAQAGLDYAGLDAVLCTRGPGAFTGLRIGLSAARGFALALDIPLYGIATTQALALDYAGKTGAQSPCLAVLETKRRDFYVQGFDARARALSPAQACEAADALRHAPPGAVLIGDGALRLVQNLQGRADPAIQPGFERPAMAAALRRLQAGDKEDLRAFFTPDPAPLYLRGADVSAPKTPPRRLAVEGAGK